MADNTLQSGNATIRTEDRAGTHTQVFGRDINIGGATEILETASPLADGTANPTVSGQAAFAHGYNGATWDRLRVNAGRELIVAKQDIISTPMTITAADAASASTAGAQGQSLITGTPTAGSVATLAITGESSFALLITGTWTGTLQFERSLDNGATWTAIGAFAAGTSQIVTTTAANGAFHGNASSATTLRVRATAWTSGTATVLILAGSGTGTITIGNPIRLFDAVSSAQATIKAASTPAAAGDTALAVTMHPSSATLATRNLKDTARVGWSAATAIAGVTAVTTEALVSLVPQRDGTAAAAATSHTVTSGKRLRVTTMTVGLISTSAAVLSGRISLRIGASGAATATSPILHTLPIPSGAALAQAGGTVTVTFPEGLEIGGTQQIGVTQVCSATTGTIWVSLLGYEY